MKAIVDRNAPIADCFFKGKAMGQQYALLEANLVFEVARLLARMDVPALQESPQNPVNSGVFFVFCSSTEIQRRLMESGGIIGGIPN